MCNHTGYRAAAHTGVTCKSLFLNPAPAWVYHAVARVVIFFVALSVAGNFLTETGNVTIKDVHQSLSKQVMEEAYSYDQGYIPWNPPPYQHHAPRYNAYQSNGYGDVCYGYEDPSPPHPSSQNASKKFFCHYVRKGKSFGKPKNELTIK
ncbi:hypothetical protein PIB30_084623 [Stylosanthes scabra]|uniref:Uncharacterized protein n=1 Tax=Stylosanthes scabra TaxID=79078 RepID=A0ABU6WR01_9FABA|nr:hypothetical protein [Stylosanthes scabra]